MKFGFVKLSANILALSVIAFSVTACNNKDESIKDEINTETTSYNDESSINETKSVTDNSDTDVESTQVQAETEEIIPEEESEQTEDIDSESMQTDKLYNPTKEILSAGFSSGFIQIGNDVFRLGGYLTVDQFISEYNDRYDMSDIDTESVWVQKENMHAKVVSLSDPDFEFTIAYKPIDDNECLVRDAIVYDIIVDNNLVHHPMGLTHFPEADVLKKDDLEPLFESLGLIRVEDAKENRYNSYVYKSGYNCYYCYFKGDEINLFGEYPVYYYRFAPLDKLSEKIGVEGNDDNVTINLRAVIPNEIDKSQWY